MTAKRRWHTPEQIVRELCAADRVLARGGPVAAARRELDVLGQTYCRWRNQDGGLKGEDEKRLKELEKQNAALKRLLVDAELKKAALKELAEGNFWARASVAPRFATYCRRSTSASGRRAVWPG